MPPFGVRPVFEPFELFVDLAEMERKRVGRFDISEYPQFRNHKPAIQHASKAIAASLLVGVALWFGAHAANLAAGGEPRRVFGTRRAGEFGPVGCRTSGAWPFPHAGRVGQGSNRQEGRRASNRQFSARHAGLGRHGERLGAGLVAEPRWLCPAGTVGPAAANPVVYRLSSGVLWPDRKEGHELGGARPRPPKLLRHEVQGCGTRSAAGYRHGALPGSGRQGGPQRGSSASR